GRGALGLTLSLGGVRLVSRGRVHVGEAARDDESLERAIATAAGLDDVRYSIHLGASDRLNVKPVLGITDKVGHTVGFVKIQRDALTERLVGNEIGVLERWERRPPSAF